MQRGQRGPVSGDEGFLVDQVPEHLPVGDERVRVLVLAAREPHRFRVIDGRVDRETMAREIWDIVEPYV